jgi:hypothetical protein
MLADSNKSADGLWKARAILLLQAGISSPEGFASGAASGFGTSGFGATGFFTAFFAGFFAALVFARAFFAFAFFAGISAQLY